MGVSCDRAYMRIDLRDFCHFLRRLPPQEPPTTPGKDHKAFPRLDNYRDLTCGWATKHSYSYYSTNSLLRCDSSKTYFLT